jgi:hypothetical protein
MPLSHYFNLVVSLNQVYLCVAQYMIGVWELGIMQLRYLGLVSLYL